MKTDKPRMESRRTAFVNLVKGAGFLTMGGLFWGNLLNEAKATRGILRPPGALPEAKFLSACIKCGACVEACPYHSLKLAVPGNEAQNGTPYFTPREIPCYMCPDIPCTVACPTDALDLKLLLSEANPSKPDINLAQMGVAYVDSENCLAHKGIRCDACYRACPLMGKAISIKNENNPETGKHAFFYPEIHKDVCTGCGVCERACITELPSIIVVSHEAVTGSTGDFYLSTKDKESKVKSENANKNGDKAETEQKTLDYLNDLEGLTDDE
ncbi:MAG TPA: ferredoxin-type protein NapG [Bacteroidales bacterium]|nr:ferredoxin-type protein NapG [Bacteroidales bacterium]